MADFHGIVASVLGLLPICREGFELLKTILDTPRTLDLSVGRVELQRDRFDEWRDIWRDEDGVEDIKFEAFAKSNSLSAKRILQQLALISQALFGLHEWEDKYGIKPNHWSEREIKDLGKYRLRDGETLTNETQGPFLERCKTNASFIRRNKFMLKKKDAPWNLLIDMLRLYNEELFTYGPKFDLDMMTRREFDLLRVMHVDELRRRALAADYEEKHSMIEDDEITARYHDLYLAAQFTVVNKFERKHSAVGFTMRDFRIEPTYTISSSSSTMALLFDYPVKKEHRVVLIEWMDDLDIARERDIMKETTTKTLILATPKPAQLLLPTCYGMVEDREKRRFGLVLAPPPHIRGHLPPLLPPGAISEKRMPTSLVELLEGRHPSCVQGQILDLGIRFRLAKKIVEAVNMMHCVGWIHKNIRSNSILFFPAANIPSRGPAGPASGYPQPLGYLDPLIVGFSSPNTPLPTSSTHSHSHSQYSSDEDREILIDRRGQRLMRITKRPHQEEINLDYYQHPDKRWNPNVRYSRVWDIYSLGVVLLEIGLWKSVGSVVDVEDEDFERVRRGFLQVTMRLDGVAGSIYGNVVRKCLAIKNSERTEAEIRELSNFLPEIGANLDKCWA